MTEREWILKTAIRLAIFKLMASEKLMAYKILKKALNDTTESDSDTCKNKENP